MHFAPNPLKIGSHRILLDEVDSTQDFAHQYLSQHADAHGVAIISRLQSKGKGRLDKKWDAWAGDNFTGSLIIKSPSIINRDNIGLLHMTVSIAVAETVQLFVPSVVQIKWPNDILVNDKKISGILIHLKWLGNKLDTIICGVGVNINQTGFSDYLQKATSIYLVTNNTVDLKNITNVFFDKMNKYFGYLQNALIEDVLHAYHQKLYGKNDSIFFQLNELEYFGKINQVGLNGLIQIEYSKGLEWFDMDQIKINY